MHARAYRVVHTPQIRVVRKRAEIAERQVRIVLDREDARAKLFGGEDGAKHPQIGRVNVDRNVIGLGRHLVLFKQRHNVGRAEMQCRAADAVT